MFQNIPQEMRQISQWVVWQYELRAGKPTKVPYSARTAKAASVTNPSAWSTFYECVNTMNTGLYSGIGFVLTDDDPYFFIDLDDPKGDQAVIDRQVEICNKANTYTEYSPSGKGLHIIGKSDPFPGRRRGSIEIYFTLRYMTMTGNIYRNAPICACNELAQALWEKLGGNTPQVSHVTPDAPQTVLDKEIIGRAIGAVNGNKFFKLYNGEWKELGLYFSQSEADQALVNLIAFYTQNHIQIKRIFRASSLGQRDKAKRDNYVNQMILNALDRKLPPVGIDELQNRFKCAHGKKNVNKQSGI